MRFENALRALALGALAAVVATPVMAESIREKTARMKSEIPTCYKKIGTAAIYEPDNNWWSGLGLQSPEALIKVIVLRSGCFSLVDRGKGFSIAERERALASGGDLRQGSNIGKGQIKAADYVIVPDIVSKNADAGGTNVGAVFGSFIPGPVGAIASGISVSKKTADVTLTVTNVRTSEQELITEGHADKTDVGWSLGGGMAGGGYFGGAGVSSYANTDVGQVVSLAYIDAYRQMVQQMGGLSDRPAADAPAQSMSVAKPSALMESPGGKRKVRDLRVGMQLYPTGQKDGVWVQVDDEMGNRGWVNSLNMDLMR